jgi:predicted site-specific integrase-resolvase
VRNLERHADYLNSGRVARILGISKRTLHNWIKAGKVPAPDPNPENGYLIWTMSDVEVARHALTEEAIDSTGNR